jgi:hypothetical protein
MLGSTTRFFLRHLLMLFWLLLASPPLILFAWLVQPDGQSVTGLIGFLLAVAWILGSWWLGETTARHMAEESDLFVAAVRHTLRDLRQRLALLPLIGGWFEPTDENSKQTTDD